MAAAEVALPLYPESLMIDVWVGPGVQGVWAGASAAQALSLAAAQVSSGPEGEREAEEEYLLKSKDKQEDCKYYFMLLPSMYHQAGRKRCATGSSCLDVASPLLFCCCCCCGARAFE